MTVDTRAAAGPDGEGHAAPPQPAPPSAASIGYTATRGLLWFGLQTGLVKVVSFLGLIALAYFLDTEDFGHVSLAYTVGMIGSLVARAGIREVLISRGAEFDRWANPAFWMSTVLGFAGTVVMVALAPLAARFYDDDRLTGLIVVLSLQHVFAGVSAIPEVKLQLQLRFRMLAALNFLSLAGLTVLTVVFAALGFKAYAFMLPWPCISAVKMALIWWAAPHRVRWNWDLRHWGGMFAENGLVLLSMLFLTISQQADYAILGRLYDEDIVGQYFWAFNLSTQALQLLAVNVASVLLPSLAALNLEPARQRDAFLRSAYLINALTAVACFLQAATAGPLVRLLFEPKWYPAIPLVQVLSIGWATYAVFHTVLSMLKARGQFATMAWLTGAGAAVFLAVVYVGAKHGGALGAAWGVVVYAVLTGPASAYVTARTLNAGWRDVWHMFGPPLIAAAVPIGIAAGVASLLPKDMPLRDLAALTVMCGVGGGLWLLTLRVALPAVFRELMLRTRQLVGRPVTQATAPAA